MYLTAAIIYAIVGVVWACYAGSKQRQYYPDGDGFHMFVALVTNMVIWPIAVVIAYVKYGICNRPD